MQCEGKNPKFFLEKNPEFISLISVKELGLKIAKKILDEENSHLVHCNWLFVLTNTDLRWVPTNPTQHEFEKTPNFCSKHHHLIIIIFQAIFLPSQHKRKSFRDLTPNIVYLFMTEKTKKKSFKKIPLEQSNHIIMIIEFKNMCIEIKMSNLCNQN